jgi:hypothetical protein
LLTHHTIEVSHESDVSYYVFNSYFWAILELNLAIICASAPALRALLRDHLDTPMARYRKANFLHAEGRKESSASKQILMDHRWERQPSDFSGYHPFATRLDSQAGLSDDGTYRSMENCHLVRTPSYPDGEAYGLQTIGSPGKMRQGSYV